MHAEWAEPGNRAVAIVMACLRPDRDGLGAAARTAAPDDWARVWSIAERHQVVGLIARELLPQCDGVPAATREEARRRAEAVAARGMALAGLLGRVIAALEGAGVPAVAFRGCALGLDAYGSVAVRQHVDLDILVARRDLRRAVPVMAELGATVHDREARLLASRVAWVEHHAMFDVAVPRTTVELHAELFPWFFALDVDADAVMARARTIAAGPVVVPTLSVADQFIELAAHGAKHGWSTLRVVCDLAATLKAHPDFDREDLLVTAARLGARRLVTCGYALADRLLGWDPPPPVCAAITEDSFASALPRLVWRRWFDPAFVPRPLFRLRMDTGCRERLRDRVRYCARAAVEPVLMGIGQVGRP